MNMKYAMRRQSGVPAKNQIISFAFDNAIFLDPEKYYTWNEFKKLPRPNPSIIKKMREHYRRGYDVVIVTSRHENNEMIRGLESIHTWRGSFPRPVKNVYFTDGELKGPLLKEIGSILHYDNDPKQRKSAEEHGIETVQPNLNLDSIVD